MLSGLAAEQRTTGLFTTISDALDDARHVLRHHLADSDVILQEQRLCSAHHQVIHTHCHQVAADGVMLIHRLRHGQLGAHAIGCCGQQWLFVLAQREQTGESAQTATHFRPGCLLGQWGEQLHCLIAGFDAHAS